MSGNVSMVNGHIDRPMTNYERIKSMSIEEMAELLLDGCRGAECDDQPKNEYGSVNCFKCRKQWLESEVDAE